MLTLSARVLGRRQPLLPDWSITWPPEADDRGEESLTLRDLLTRVVLEEVGAYRRRQRERRLARVLAPREIEDALERGRVDAGGRDLMQEVNDEEAVATALQAFEDGVYLVILDGDEQRDLDRQVFVRPDSHIVFVRLVMLAGG